ncbi:TIGR01777 family oxidoreductase [Sinomicrobium weinanense]|uniref:TIGR01777 family protein n=1 Tax=Sinomicrobium weinanense TaxID=2842200 RepID=A0A926JRZ2_9FLAO|nr:TIGR01777 family oxidoreductase [Sinomicrobium weinanense]MBC9796167.1 TIGR01777 family protein [Sinomicrobium weinanense]MBU3123446.1 TIGR01777 family oxidoreductase [Sinomicrobium weinanense]
MRVLIIGATGLIGREIVRLYTREGIAVNYLTTDRSKIENMDMCRGFYWNPGKGEIDRECLDDVEAIINLAGEPIAKRWTAKHRKRILGSRVRSLELLQNTLGSEEGHRVKMLISASAIGIYPDSLTHYYGEEEKEVDDSFPGRVIQEWEAAADRMQELGIKVAKVRIGLVLSKEGGMLPQIVKPVKYFAGAAFGSGKQWQSWIHITDLARIFLFVLEKQTSGIFNGVAPNPVTNEKLTCEIAGKLQKPLILPRIPRFVMKCLLGKMSYLLFCGQRVSSRKMTDMGFSFKYPNLGPALDNLLGRE